MLQKKKHLHPPLHSHLRSFDVPFLFVLSPPLHPVTGFFFTEFLFFRRWNSATSVESPRAHLSAYLCDYLLFNTHTHTHRGEYLLRYLFLSFFCFVRLIQTSALLALARLR